MTSPDAPDLAFERWASAEQSRARPFDLPRPKCLSEIGCPFEPAAIPVCPRAIEALTVSEAIRASERHLLVKPQLFIKGSFLADKTQTLLACGANTCCNGAGGRFKLVEPDRTRTSETTLFVSSRSRPNAFSCRGDDSAVCCDFESAEVIAFGRIHGQDLIDPLLCRPR